MLFITAVLSHISYQNSLQMLIPIQTNACENYSLKKYLAYPGKNSRNETESVLLFSINADLQL